MVVTTSRLRDDIYRILDAVLETGEPVEIKRKGRVLRIVSDAPPWSRASRIRLRPGLLNGDANDLDAVGWSGAWQPDGLNPEEAGI